jgi:hypothetical protein
VKSLGFGNTDGSFANTHDAFPFKKILGNSSPISAHANNKHSGVLMKTYESTISLKNMKPTLQTISETLRSNGNNKINNNAQNVILPTNDTATNLNLQT